MNIAHGGALGVGPGPGLSGRARHGPGQERKPLRDKRLQAVLGETPPYYSSSQAGHGRGMRSGAGLR